MLSLRWVGLLREALDVATEKTVVGFRSQGMCRHRPGSLHLAVNVSEVKYGMHTRSDPRAFDLSL